MNARPQLALFEAFPALAERLPWRSLGSFPTPVQRLDCVCEAELWIKRDDQSSSLYGGNKVRKLEFILADMQRRGANHLVTMGSIGTHHGLACAVHSARVGIGCTVILSEQPLREEVRQNLKLMHAHGARLILGGSVIQTGLRFFLTQRLRQPGAYFLYAGGSSPVGALGFVSAAFELKQQIERGELPLPSHIFCALGSKGTLAGLALGVALAGLEAEVIGVRVYPARIGPIHVTTPKAVLGLMRKALGRLRRADPGVPDIPLRAPRAIDGYLGQGYAYQTEAGDLATALLQEKAGIALEPTYTAKTFAALLDFARSEEAGAGPLLYWHTFSSVDLSAAADRVEPADLPPSLQRYFSR